jgi:hypothetical protein
MTETRGRCCETLFHAKTPYSDLAQSLQLPSRHVFILILTVIGAMEQPPRSHEGVDVRVNISDV